MLLIYKVQQFTVQYRMRLAINDSETSFEKLVLDIIDYQSVRLNSREIYYKGDLYDVKSVNITGDKAELLVIKDVRERILLQEIKDFLQKSTQSKKELPNQLQKFLSVNYLATDQGQIIYFPHFILNSYPDADRNLLCKYSDIPSPPPKYC